MLSFPSYHSKEGIEELRIVTAEGLHDHLIDAEWEFINTSPDPDLPTVTCTIGNARYGRPDLVIGANLTELAAGRIRAHVESIFAYMDWLGEPIEGDIDLTDFYSFCVLHRGYETVEPFIPDDRLYLRRINSEQWFMGMGWQHAAYYTEEERKNAVIYQWMLPDTEGRIPLDEGFNGIGQLIMEVEAFGETVEFEPSPERAALAKYLH